MPLPSGDFFVVFGALEFAMANTCKGNKWRLMCLFFVFVSFLINKPNEVGTSQFLSLVGGSF